MDGLAIGASAAAQAGAGCEALWGMLPVNIAQGRAAAPAEVQGNHLQAAQARQGARAQQRPQQPGRQLAPLKVRPDEHFVQRDAVLQGELKQPWQSHRTHSLQRGRAGLQSDQAARLQTGPTTDRCVHPDMSLCHCCDRRLP